VIRRALLIAFAAAASVCGLDATSADNLASAIITDLGRTRGVCALPLAGDGQLARAMLQRSAMLVHATETATAGVDAVRAVVLPTGLIGSRACVDKGTASVLPYADNFVDLIVVTNLTDAGLAGVSYAEIQRVLCAGGKAWIGRATAEGGGVTQAALQSWYNAATRTLTTATTSAANGVWAVITKQTNPRTDSWTHTTHGPDNNPVSLDSVVKWPFLPQWWQKPMGSDRAGGVVSANGRVYVALGQGSIMLRAYRSANGQVLWNKVLQQQINPVPVSFMVAASGGLYAVQGNNKVAFYDGESGTQTQLVTFDASTTRRVKWLALSGSLLYALVGDSAADTGMVRPGNAVYAYNTGTQTMAWTKTYTGSVDGREIGIAGGKLFFYLQGLRVMALNAATGDSLWAQADAGVLGLLGNRSNYDWSWCTYPATGFLCSQYGLYICSPPDSAVVALSSSDGHLLWTGAKNWWGRMLPKFILGTELVDPYGAPSDKCFFDVNTQTTSARYATLDFGGGCGMRTASQDGFFGNWGGQACSFSANRSITQQYYKADCGVGTILFDGMMMAATVGCQCTPNRGTIVNASAGSFVFDQSAVQAQRLESGPAYGNIVTQVQADSLDWWTHRGNANRTGYAPVSVPLTPHLMTSLRPTFPYDTTPDMGGGNGGSTYGDHADALPTPPVMVGGLVFWAGSDGYVRCFDVYQNHEAWSFATGGAIRATPAVWDGCVYVGSEDGFAYCLEAHTGRLVWRFRGAPADRRINLYGHLSSTWPVNSGITIAGGDVIFAAGLFGDFGTHVYALNAKTGAITWQNNGGGTFYKAQDRVGITPAGYGITVRGTYWQRALNGRNGIFSLTDGAIRPLPGSPSSLAAAGGPSTYGAEMMRLDSSHVLYGCDWLFMPAGHSGFSDRKRTFVAQSIDAQGNALYPEVSVALNSTCAPAWDPQAFVAYIQNGHSSGWLERWNTAAYIRVVDSVRAANTTAAEANVSGWPAFAGTAATPLAQWATPVLEAKAIALASNAVVVTVSDWTSADRWNAATWKWSLCLLARNALDTLWRTTLPGTPVRNGVAIGRGGEIVVALESGTILVYGSGTVSVATSGLEMSVAEPMVTAATSATAWHVPEACPSAQPERGVAVNAVIHAAAAAAEHGSIRSVLITNEPSSAGASVACRASPETYAITHPQENTGVYVARDMRWRSNTACLPVKSVCASSGNARATIDGDLRTRWTGKSGGGQWLTYDLGRVCDVSALSIVWYSLRLTSCGLTIELSQDGATFTEADAAALQGRGTNETLRSFVGQPARYVRVKLASAAGASPVSLYEVGIHQSGEERQAAR
jgi:outer membrane protein assembly factor BamB